MATSPQQLLADAQLRLSELLRAGPAADLERNLKALLAQTFQRLELVTREEFEVERERLARLQARLEALERHLQAASGAGGGAPASGAAISPTPGEDTRPAPPANPYQMPPANPR